MAILLASLSAYAKTTYLPSYDNKLIIIDGGKVDSIESYRRTLDYTTSDGTISCSVVQQLVTPELVKDIKRMKRIAGWSAAAGALSAASSGISGAQLSTGRGSGYDVVNYINMRENTAQSINQAADASAKADELMELLIELVVKNNSDKEILVNDMNTGQNWFVLPNSWTYISIRKDENISLRVSSVVPLNENVKYFHIVSTSDVRKYDLSLETDSYWYIPNQYTPRKKFHCTEKTTGGYIKIDKESMQGTIISEEEFKKLKK